ncbi:MAG: MarR family winged helix-turn-helix transcriptional regulator [Desulfovibrionaceae bacterium]
MPTKTENSAQLATGHLLAQVCRLVGTRRRVQMERIGLHHAQGMILFRLWQADGIPQRVLARDMRVTPPTASSTLRRMERDGWIERRRDPADHRVVRVFLTEKSRRLHDAAHASFAALEREMTAILTEGEHDVLRRCLLKVQHYLIAAGGQDHGLGCLSPVPPPEGKDKGAPP